MIIQRSNRLNEKKDKTKNNKDTGDNLGMDKNNPLKLKRIK